MSVDYQDYTYRVKGVVKNNASLTIRLMLEDIHRNSATITPMADTKYLRTGVRKRLVDNNEGFIEWVAPYAAYQERGKWFDDSHVVRHYTTPGTGKEFAKRSVKKTMSNARKFMQMGGLI